jgi:hypothetical protein
MDDMISRIVAEALYSDTGSGLLQPEKAKVRTKAAIIGGRMRIEVSLLQIFRVMGTDPSIPQFRFLAP